MKKVVIISVTVLIVSILCIAQLKHDKSKTSPKTQESSGSVTLANFQKIKIGMSKAEVFKLLGKGQETSTAGEGKYVLTTYSWKAGFMGANCVVMFQNGKVNSKGQLGLK